MDKIKLVARLERIVSHSDEVEGILGDEAYLITSRARAKLAPHRKSGDHKITQTKGKIDHFVNLEGPAALAVEEGHFVHSKNDIKFVPGLHILRDSIGPSV